MRRWPAASTAIDPVPPPRPGAGSSEKRLWRRSILTRTAAARAQERRRSRSTSVGHSMRRPVCRRDSGAALSVALELRTAWPSLGGASAASSSSARPSTSWRLARSPVATPTTSGRAAPRAGKGAVVVLRRAIELDPRGTARSSRRLYALNQLTDAITVCRPSSNPASSAAEGLVYYNGDQDGGSAMLARPQPSASTRPTSASVGPWRRPGRRGYPGAAAGRRAEPRARRRPHRPR